VSKNERWGCLVIVLLVVFVACADALPTHALALAAVVGIAAAGVWWWKE